MKTTIIALGLITALSGTFTAAKAQNVNIQVEPLAINTAAWTKSELLQKYYKKAIDSLSVKYATRTVNPTYSYKFVSNISTGSDVVTYFPNFQFKNVFGLYAGDKEIVTYTAEIKNLEKLSENPKAIVKFFVDVYTPVFVLFSGKEAVPEAAKKPTKNLFVSYAIANDKDSKAIKKVVEDVFASNFIVSNNYSVQNSSDRPTHTIYVEVASLQNKSQVAFKFENGTDTATTCGAPLKTEFDVTSQEKLKQEYSYLFARVTQTLYEYTKNN